MLVLVLERGSMFSAAGRAGVGEVVRRRGLYSEVWESSVSEEEYICVVWGKGEGGVNKATRTKELLPTL